jgi:hypothetical protein
MPKDREHCAAIAVVDRVVAPHPARHITAVETEQLVDFGAGEELRPVAASIVAQRKDRRARALHRRPPLDVTKL